MTTDLKPEDRAPFELLPCPFCGDAEIEVIAGALKCCGCGAIGPCDIRDASRAKVAWNTRAEGLSSPSGGGDLVLVPRSIEGVLSAEGYAISQYGCSASKTASDRDENWHGSMNAAYAAMISAAASTPPPPTGEVGGVEKSAFIDGYKAAWSGRGDHTEPRREYIAKLAVEAWESRAAPPSREA